MIASHEIASAAIAMSEDDAGFILTWTDEPDLIAEPGELPPTFSPLQIAAARLKGAMIVAEVLGNSRH